VGHGGAQLSGLTEYLIALSRALMENPSLLIVEEPEIELSTDEKALVNDALLRAFEDRAVLLIARTLNAIAACDQVVMIDHGRVAAQGTHADLMAKSSAYRDLVHRELSGSLAGVPAR
jgi:subfamily B ATP-binding cassette protein MsbA